MTNFLVIYYIIGMITSLYFIHYYRISNKTKTNPTKHDAWLALFGVWVFPLQIIKHIYDRWKPYHIDQY